MDLTEINGLIYLWEIEQYNNKSSAITFISESLSEQQFILQTIENEENYRFNVGRPRLLRKGSKIMITISSLLFLHKYNLIKDLVKNYDLIILRSMVEYFQVELENIEREIIVLEHEINNNSREIVFNKLEIRKYLEEYKKEKIKIEKTFEILKTARIIDIYDSYDADKVDLSYKIKIYKNIDMDNLFNLVDLETAYFAGKYNINILIDDQITSSLFSDYFSLNSELISTTAGIINSLILDDTARYIDILEKLIDIRYEYVWDYASLFKVLFNYKDFNDKEKLNELLDETLRKDYNDYYKNIIRRILFLDLLEKDQKSMIENLLENYTI